MCRHPVFSLFLFIGRVLGQRYERYGAVELDDAAVIPRVYLTDAPQLLGRQDGGCGTNSHPCVDVKEPTHCCNNEQYCYIGPSNFEAKCCSIGAPCDNPCSNPTLYLCRTGATSAGSTSTGTACCPKTCPQTSYFQCKSEQGGGCCHYGESCVSSSCVKTLTSDKPPLVTPLGEGCSTNQHRCDDGEGCCDNLRHCTRSDGTAVCALGNPTMSGVVEIRPAGLSAAAKAGIGAGVAVGASILIGAVTWLCLVKRRHRRSEAQRTGGDNMTEVSSVTQNRPGRGLTQDYFGPAAAAGPFTDTHGGSEATSPGRNRGVATRPQNPDDIVAPVEIDSRVTPGHEDPVAAFERPLPETPSGRFELEGSELPSPSPPMPSPGSRDRAPLE